MRDDSSTPRAFRSGDRVRYWRSGPVMHVISASGDLCYCNWVDEFGVLQQGTFDQRNLTHASFAGPGDAVPG